MKRGKVESQFNSGYRMKDIFPLDPVFSLLMRQDLSSLSPIPQSIIAASKYWARVGVSYWILGNDITDDGGIYIGCHQLSHGSCHATYPFLLRPSGAPLSTYLRWVDVRDLKGVHVIELDYYTPKAKCQGLDIRPSLNDEELDVCQLPRV